MDFESADTGTPWLSLYQQELQVPLDEACRRISLAFKEIAAPHFHACGWKVTRPYDPEATIQFLAESRIGIHSPHESASIFELMHPEAAARKYLRQLLERKEEKSHE